MPRRVDTDSLVRLTRVTIAKLALEPGQSERVWWDAELAGFGYRLRSGRGTWVIRPPRAGGRSSLVTLGAAGLLDAAEARKLAREQLAKAVLGGDVRATRHAERAERTKAGLTVRTAFDRYTVDARERMRPSTLANLKTHLDTHWQGLHGLPLAAVRRSDVAEQLRGITKGHGPQAALRARRTLSTVFSWCIGEDLCELNPVINSNVPAVEVRRERVLTDDEVAAVWRACPATRDYGRIVRLLILTGAREGEVAGLRWDELDLDAATWRLPAARSKNKRAHIVPLSSPAVAILAGAPRLAGRALVFGIGAGPFSGFSRAKKMLDRRLGFAEPWVLHDLRRTCATGLARLGTPVEVIERALNHTSGTFRGIVGTYQRHDYMAERRIALDTWGAHVETLVAHPDV